jgi:hypothetical protein
LEGFQQHLGTGVALVGEFVELGHEGLELFFDLLGGLTRPPLVSS